MKASFLFLQSAHFPSQTREGETSLSKAWIISTSNLYKNIIGKPV